MAGEGDTGRIDIVYLWVDGSDPEWQARRQQALARWAPRFARELAPYGNVAGRYRDNGELRFNLRALERFFPHHGHVYVVTDRQVPRWLRRGPGITFVDHGDLIPPHRLPVFDSGHIESWIHHIDGLSERFFYLNDDTFFGAPVDLDDWFGPPVSVPLEPWPAPAHERMHEHATAPINAAAYSAAWLRAHCTGYRHTGRLIAHAPRPLLRSALHTLERRAPELFERARSTVFRSWQVPPIVCDLLLRWMVHVGLARERIAHEAHYVASGDPAAPGLLQDLQRRFGRLPFFCINDTCDDAPADDPRLRRVAAVLQSLLPSPSPFEWGGVAVSPPQRAVPGLPSST